MRQSCPLVQADTEGEGEEGVAAGHWHAWLRVCRGRDKNTSRCTLVVCTEKVSSTENDADRICIPLESSGLGLLHDYYTEADLVEEDHRFDNASDARTRPRAPGR